MREAEVFAALLARVDAAQLRGWSACLLHKELQRVQMALSDALAVMQHLQEVQANITKLEREQAVIGIHSGRTDGVMALVDETQRLNERVLSALARFPALQQETIRTEGGRIVIQHSNNKEQPEIQSNTRVEEQSGAVECVLPLRAESKYDEPTTSQRVNSQHAKGNDRVIPVIAPTGDDVDVGAVEPAALSLRAERKDDEPAPAMRVHRKRSRKEIAAAAAVLRSSAPLREDLSAREEEKRYLILQRSEPTRLKAELPEPSASAMAPESKSEPELDAQPKTAPRQRREHIQASIEPNTPSRQRRQHIPAKESTTGSHVPVLREPPEEKPSRSDEEENFEESTEEPAQPMVAVKQEQTEYWMSADEQILTSPEQQHQHSHATKQLGTDEPMRSQVEQENQEEVALVADEVTMQPAPPEREKARDKESHWYYITGPESGTIVPVGKKSQPISESQQSVDHVPMSPPIKRDQGHGEALIVEMEPELEPELEQEHVKSQMLSADELIQLMQHEHRQDQEEAQLSADESMESEHEQDQEDSSQPTTEDPTVRSLVTRDQQEDDAEEHVLSMPQQELEQDHEDSQIVFEVEPTLAPAEQQQQERQERSPLATEEPNTSREQEQCDEASEPSPKLKTQSSPTQARGEEDESRIGLASGMVPLGAEGPTLPAPEQQRGQEETQSVADEPMSSGLTQDHLQQHQQECKAGPEDTIQPAQDQARKVIVDTPLDVAAVYKPIAFPFANETVDESRLAEEDATAIPPATTEQPTTRDATPATAEQQASTEVAQQRPEERQPVEPTIQWSLLTDACYSGANQFEKFPPELKPDRLNWVLQPLQILFDKVIQSSESANRELVTRDHAHVELAVLAFTACVAGQPIPPYRLNGYRYFLKSMDGAMTRVEQLGSRLAKYQKRLEAAMAGKLKGKAKAKAADSSTTTISTSTTGEAAAPVAASESQLAAFVDSKILRTAITQLKENQKQRRRRVERERAATQVRVRWEAMLRKCTLSEEEFDTWPTATQLSRARLSYSGIHQFFEKVFKTESNTEQCVSTELLNSFAACIRATLNCTPNLPLPRKKVKHMLTKIAEKMLKAESCSERLQLLFGE